MNNKWFVFKENYAKGFYVAKGAVPEHTDSGTETIAGPLAESDAKEMSDQLNRKIGKFDAIYEFISSDYEAMKAIKPRKKRSRPQESHDPSGRPGIKGRPNRKVDERQ